ncbi:DUF2911 domain-containing protein [uncultured Mucilaginibacter sp.]|uniref:DUF2911 domain-containing protein n=1 Tax=uncultured Mucilaginibacter sp. TaxID=797541 RepID=UPI0025DFF74B|nr:DUF2911 domain-containing protein [uncultured Mucilaginibacter sp.]
MKRSFQLKALAFFVCAFLVSTMAFAQLGKDGKPVPSPRDSVSGTVAGSSIKIWYGSPSVKGRVVYGELEPWDKVYRAGANEATQFTTSKDIKVEGQVLPAGTYAFFVIPAKTGKWTVIFNKKAKQWGAFSYDKSLDQLRVMVTPKTISNQERMVYKLNKKGFSMDWATTSVPVAIGK